MDRRTAIKYTTLVSGATLSTAFIGGFLSGCKPDTLGSLYIPVFLNNKKYRFLQSFVDVLIPATETPGGSELGVPETIDTIVGKCYKKKQKEDFLKSFNLIYDTLNRDPKKRFVDKNNKEKKQEIISLEASLTENKDLSEAYNMLKNNVGTCYLGTEHVGSNLLNYISVPGEYKPCISVSEAGGKAYTYE